MLNPTKAAMLGLVFCSAIGPTTSASAQTALQPANEITADGPLDSPRVAGMVLAARRWWTIFSTGDASLIRQAAAPSFRDNTLPEGRAQGRDGAIAAFQAFRAGMPDIRCDINAIMIVRDLMNVRGTCRGTFSGQFLGRQGRGERFEFAANDTYRVRDGQITEIWHLEDYLSLFTRTGHATMTQGASVSSPADEAVTQVQPGRLSVALTASLDASPVEVWRLIGDFNNLPAWYPRVRTSSFDPATQVRTLTFQTGSVVTERLLESSERQQIYTTIKGSLPVRNYRVILSVRPGVRSGQSVVDWRSTFDAQGVPDAEATAAVRGAYQYGLDQLKVRWPR